MFRCCLLLALFCIAPVANAQIQYVDEHGFIFVEPGSNPGITFLGPLYCHFQGDPRGTLTIEHIQTGEMKRVNLSQIHSGDLIWNSPTLTGTYELYVFTISGGNFESLTIGQNAINTYCEVNGSGHAEFGLTLTPDIN